jgi:diguanylate cyclase (GGDEF)-like protein
MFRVPTLDDLPASPYARELRRGVKNGPFEAELEGTYRLSHLARVRRRARAWFTLMFILESGWAIAALLGVGPSGLLSAIRTILIYPCIATILWLTWSRHYESLYLRVAPPLIILNNGVFAAFIAHAIHRGDTQILAPLTLNILAVFFFTGLLFRQALITSFVMLAAFVCGAAMFELSFLVTLKGVAICLMTGTIAAMVNRDVDRSYRINFLEHELLGELAARDGLSGLMNRRAFDEHLLRIWQQALRDQKSIAVLMIDIDHFKRYNDTFGHQAGDIALRGVAHVAQGFARRPLDMTARYGGEEFVLVLYDLALVEVLDIAERLRRSVEDLRARTPGSTDEIRSPLTVSLGVGLAVPTIGRTHLGAVQLADEALYDAKNAGRNRVSVKGTDAYLLLTTGAFQSKLPTVNANGFLSRI